jgi:hypothetical protein
MSFTVADWTVADVAAMLLFHLAIGVPCEKNAALLRVTLFPALALSS